MSNQNIQNAPIRIPNLPTGAIVDANGMPTTEELAFRQALLNLLETYAGAEGLVAPSQSATNRTAIQNHTQEIPGATPSTVYTCAFGTMLYTPSTTPTTSPADDSFNIAMNNAAGAPIFKQVFLLTGTDAAAGAISTYGIVNLNGAQYKIALNALS